MQSSPFQLNEIGESNARPPTLFNVIEPDQIKVVQKVEARVHLFAASVKPLKLNGYRQQVSILCPRSYEPRALPLRHAGDKVLMFMVPRAVTTSFCKAGKLNSIDSEVRTRDLGPTVHLFR